MTRSVRSTHPKRSAGLKTAPKAKTAANPDEQFFPKGETDLTLTFPPPTELPVLGDVSIYRWTKIFKGMRDHPQLKELIVQRHTHYQGLLMAIKRHNQTHHKSALIGIRLVHDRDGSPLFWRLRRIAVGSPTEDFELENRTKSATVTPYSWCRAHFNEVLEQGWSNLGPRPICVEYFQRWLFQLIYRHTPRPRARAHTLNRGSGGSAKLREIRQEVQSLRAKLSVVLGARSKVRKSDDESSDAEERSWLRNPEKTIAHAIPDPKSGVVMYRITFSPDFAELLRAIPVIIASGRKITAMTKLGQKLTPRGNRDDKAKDEPPVTAEGV